MKHTQIILGAIVLILFGFLGGYITNKKLKQINLVSKEIITKVEDNKLFMFLNSFIDEEDSRSVHFDYFDPINHVIVLYKQYPTSEISWYRVYNYRDNILFNSFNNYTGIRVLSSDKLLGWENNAEINNLYVLNMDGVLIKKIDSISNFPSSTFHIIKVPDGWKLYFYNNELNTNDLGCYFLNNDFNLTTCKG